VRTNASLLVERKPYKKPAKKPKQLIIKPRIKMEDYALEPVDQGLDVLAQSYL